MEENWKSVLDYEGYYEVSDLGRVRSVDRKSWSPGFNCYQTRKGRILKPGKNGHKGRDYFAVVLCKEGLEKTIRVHILVLEAYVGPRPLGMVACHGPKGRFDNSLSNLSWGTKQKNQGEDKLRDGTDNSGDKNGMSKLTNQEVKEIYKMAWSGKYKQKEIAEMFGIHPNHVVRIKLGKSQSRVTGHFRDKEKI